MSDLFFLPFENHDQVNKDRVTEGIQELASTNIGCKILASYNSLAFERPSYNSFSDRVAGNGFEFRWMSGKNSTDNSKGMSKV